jgi:hypothetical protein
LVLAAVVAGGVFALPAFRLSAGGGGFIGGDFGGGVEGKASGQKMTIETPYFGGGGFAFFDATYAELTLGLFGGGGTVEVMIPGLISSDNSLSLMSFNIGLLGKYPFAVNEKLSVFPLLGIEYDIVFSAKIDGDDYEGSKTGSSLDFDGGPGDFSTFWFKFGGGLDYSFTEKIYLRGEVLYGLRLANKAEKDFEDLFKDLGQLGNVDVDTDTLLGHGLTVKLGVGYKF